MSSFPAGSLAQANDQETIVKEWRKWQISLNVGVQMSGIKDEDFIKSNYSPLLNVFAGRWFSPAFGLQLGYKGWYFNTIADEKRHGYGFYYADAVLNVLELFNGKDVKSNWYLNLHGGGGYFYNYDYMKPNICAIAGFSAYYQFNSRFLASFDAAAIMGWDIYQGNADILPGLSLGLGYVF